MRSRHTAPSRRSRRPKQSDSPTGLLGGPEALIYQLLSLTPTGQRGGPSASRRRASAASAAPPPADPLGVGVPHPHPLRCLLNSSLIRSITCSQKEVTALLPLSLDNSASRIAGGERLIRFPRLRLRRTVFQRMLRQIHARIAMVVTRGRLFSDSVHVFTGAPVSGEHLRHPVSQGGPLSHGGRFLYPDA